MKRYFFKDNNGIEYRRISKKAAEKRYNAGLTTIFCPVNLFPFNRFFPVSMEINRENINCNFQAFQTIVNEFEYYNCSCNETGYYTAFYAPIEK